MSLHTFYRHTKLHMDTHTREEITLKAMKILFILIFKAMNKTDGNLTAWDFPFYGSNNSLVANYFSYMWLLQPITTPFIYGAW